jgi:glycosyltransferase involved in cell wall biosynthesis
MIAGIDGRSLARGQAGRGVSRYTSSLVQALAESFPQDRWRLLVPGGPATPPPAGVEVVAPRLPRQVLFAAGAVAGRPRLDRLAGPSDVTWLPAPAPAALSRGARYVLTVHDLSFHDRPGDYTAYERAWHRLGRLGTLARRATRVIAVSAATRDAAVEAWGLDPARVTVVPSGVSGPAAPPSAAAVEAVRRRHGLPERYLLWVGALEPRKAPDILARAYARARADGLDAGLAVVGEGRVPLEGAGVRRLGAVRDRSELDALYAGALALAMPSRAEGYGFAPLEAAACGTPSIVTDIPALRETLGDAARFVPVDDEATLAAALVELAADPALRDRLATAAAKRLVGRTWAAAAEATHAVLREAAG